jgi:hypothetical protein
VADPLAASLLAAWIDGDPTRDGDGDGVPDDLDVCPLDPDPGQPDADGDDVGDACDADCADGIDDDGDGFTDFPADPGCQNTLDWAREDPECSNGLDDDADGAMDYPLDRECGAPWMESELQPGARLGCGMLGIEAGVLLIALSALRGISRGDRGARARRPGRVSP